MSAFVCGASYQNHKPADDVSGCPSLGLSASFPVLVAGIPEEGDEVSVEGGKRLEMASNAGNDMMSPHQPRCHVQVWLWQLFFNSGSSYSLDNTTFIRLCIH